MDFAQWILQTVNNILFLHTPGGLSFAPSLVNLWFLLSLLFVAGGEGARCGPRLRTWEVTSELVWSMDLDSVELTSEFLSALVLRHLSVMGRRGGCENWRGGGLEWFRSGGGGGSCGRRMILLERCCGQGMLLGRWRSAALRSYKLLTNSLQSPYKLLTAPYKALQKPYKSLTNPYKILTTPYNALQNSTEAFRHFLLFEKVSKGTPY